MEYIYLGSSPLDEDCAQVGADNYFDLSRLELEAYKKGLEEKFKDIPEGARFVIKEGEVVVACRDQDAFEWACKVEDKAAKECQTWEQIGLKKPRLDDPEFTKTELIPVPEPPFLRWQSVVPEVCDMQYDGVVRCKEKIGNEFFDARTKQGQWGCICPKCMGRWGVGLGTGKGQRYKKAVDGNFYKTEG